MGSKKVAFNEMLAQKKKIIIQNFVVSSLSEVLCNPRVLMEFLRELCICPICKDTLDDPRILGCLHTFCFSCLLRHFVYSRANGITCPICKAHFRLVHEDIETLMVNVWATSVLDYFGMRKEKTASDINGAILAELGRIYDGCICKNEKLAYKWYKKAADDFDYPKACEWMGSYFYKIQKYDEALTYLQKGADAGNSLSQVALGDIYRLGRGTPQDLDKAIEWYEKALDAGEKCMNNLGHVYYKKREMDKAFLLFKKASELSIRQGSYNLGLCYEFGYGTPIDYEAALREFTKAKKEGWHQSIAHIGYFYHEGLGVPKDEQKAFTFFQEAQDHGVLDAYAYLARCYEKCSHVRQDLKRAEEYFRKSAECNNTWGLYQCGLFLIRQYPENVEIGESYIRKAADLGSFDAKEAWNEIRTKKL